MVKLRILPWGDYPGLFVGFISKKSLLVKEGSRRIRVTVSWFDQPSEARNKDSL